MTKQPTAAETYAQRRADIDRLLDVLAGDLTAHAHKAGAAPGDWSYPGDLGKVRSDLIDLVAFMGNTDPSRIEAVLADLAQEYGTGTPPKPGA